MSDKYKLFMEQHQNISLDDVKGLIDQIPIEIKNKLAKGPIDYRWKCGVCDAFQIKKLSIDEVLELQDPILTVWIYHEIPKVKFRFADQNHYGSGANEIYRRCIETYRAAGWAGEASEPNA